MLTQTTEHALRALLFLGRQPKGDRFPAATIARHTGIPSAYLAKLLQTLGARGWVESRLGRTGGFALAHPLHDIRVADLMDLFAAPQGGRFCLLGSGPCDALRPCVAHVRWSAAQRTAHRAIGQLRLSELLDESGSNGDAMAAAPRIGSQTRMMATHQETP